MSVAAQGVSTTERLLSETASRGSLANMKNIVLYAMKLYEKSSQNIQIIAKVPDRASRARQQF